MSNEALLSGTPSDNARTNLAYLVPICLVATLGGLLFGYDTGVISGAIEPLTAKFGLSDVMKGWASGCVLLGCAAGVLGRSALVLLCYAPGVWAYSLNHVLARAFYARGDTKTPMCAIETLLACFTPTALKLIQGTPGIRAT